MNIEDFIKNKNADIHEPDVNALWIGIEGKRNSKNNKKSRILKWIAAAILIGILAGIWVKHEINMQQKITSLSQINKHLAAQEQACITKVSAKWNAYTSTPGNDSPIAPFLFDQLKQLDTIYNLGIKNIDENGLNNREVILLLDTYEKRLRIIEKLIYEKNKQANYENKIKKLDI